MQRVLSLSFLVLLAACPDTSQSVACTDDADCVDGNTCWSDNICRFGEDLTGPSPSTEPSVSPEGEPGAEPDGEPSVGPTPEPGTDPDATPDAEPDPAALQIAHLVTGDRNVCAVDGAGGVSCFGLSRFGAIGGSTSVTTDDLPLTRLDALTEVTSFSMDIDHSCFVGTVNGTSGAFCRGNGYAGKRGAPSEEVISQPYNQLLADQPSFVPVEIAINPRNGCVRGTVDVYCWGPDVDGWNDSAARPVWQSALAGTTDLHVGENFLCASTASGVICVEPGGFEHAGCSSNQPCAVLADATAYSANGVNGCWIEDGTVHCAGENDYGVVVPSAPSDGDVAPQAIPLPETAIDVIVHTQGACALLDDGTVHCWGRNLWNQNGLGNAEVGEPCVGDALCHEPTQVTLLGEQGAIAGSYGFTCTHNHDRSFVCWGQKDDGYGPTVHSLPPQ